LKKKGKIKDWEKEEEMAVILVGFYFYEWEREPTDPWVFGQARAQERKIRIWKKKTIVNEVSHTGINPICR
jgi:hypothetical protein